MLEWNNVGTETFEWRATGGFTPTWTIRLVAQGEYQLFRGSSSSGKMSTSATLEEAKSMAQRLQNALDGKDAVAEIIDQIVAALIQDRLAKCYESEFAVGQSVMWQGHVAVIDCVTFYAGETEHDYEIVVPSDENQRHCAVKGSSLSPASPCEVNHGEVGVDKKECQNPNCTKRYLVKCWTAERGWFLRCQSCGTDYTTLEDDLRSELDALRAKIMTRSELDEIAEAVLAAAHFQKRSDGATVVVEEFRRRFINSITRKQASE